MKNNKETTLCEYTVIDIIHQQDTPKEENCCRNNFVMEPVPNEEDHYFFTCPICGTKLKVKESREITIEDEHGLISDIFKK